MKTKVVAVAILLGVTLAGCPRHVVLDPEVAAQKNSKDWTVKSEPRKPAPPAPAAPTP